MDTKPNNSGPIVPVYLVVSLFTCLQYLLHIFTVVCAHIKFASVHPFICRSVASGFSFLCCVTNSEKLNTAENKQYEYCK